jgi:hypothetical protein
MDTSMQGYQYLPVVMEEFDGAELMFIRREDDNRFYIPIAHLCTMLGIASGTQIERIKGDGRFAIEEMPVPTRGGKQKMPCLWSKEAALWVVTVGPKRCKESVRDRLEEIQQALMDVATRLLWGDLSTVARDRQIERPIRGELYYDCPRCGAPCCVIAEGGMIHVRIA